MKKDASHFRRVILRKIYSHLEKYYSNDIPKMPHLSGLTSPRHLESLLAFKSDSPLEQFRAALDRLDSGTFGTCLRCGEEIDGMLIDADPTRRLCEPCEHVYSPRVMRHAGIAQAV